MERISKDEVKHLAELSSISLSEEEISNLQTDLGNIVEYIEQLSELNTDDVEPTYSVSKNQNVWREDEINVNQMNYINELNQRIEKLEKK